MQQSHTLWRSRSMIFSILIPVITVNAILPSQKVSSAGSFEAAPLNPEPTGTSELSHTVGVAAKTDARNGVSKSKEWLQSELNYLGQEGRVGMAGVVAVFTIWICCFLPAAPVEMALGFMYGSLPGLALGVLSKTIASIAVFLSARRMCSWFGWDGLSALGVELRALQQKPILTMMGIRIAPLPLNVKNYGLGMTDVRLYQFIIANLLADIPASFLWASTGAHCKSLADALSLKKSVSWKSFIAHLSNPSLMLLTALSLVLLVLLIQFFRRQSSGPSCTNVKSQQDGLPVINGREGWPPASPVKRIYN
eukprot:TRINITY_DN21035_c1_g1_i1.p1 TRINITY_DN21035_c1_g1~~TRINITY_DN21035_c1_g1_i1.p1  ORF type:complete len:308 (-),score=36.30 TRINITY_DN21035_c1_g1_i1:155-1078(-)